MQIVPISNAPAGAISLVLAGMAAPEFKTSIIHIAANDREMISVAQSLRFFAPNTNILEFPAWDTLPYDRASPNPIIVAQRINTLHQLTAPNSQLPTILITTANAVLQKLPKPQVSKNRAFWWKRGNLIRAKI